MPRKQSNRAGSEKIIPNTKRCGTMSKAVVSYIVRIENPQEMNGNRSSASNQVLKMCIVVFIKVDLIRLGYWYRNRVARRNRLSTKVVIQMPWRPAAAGSANRRQAAIRHRI